MKTQWIVHCAGTSEEDQAHLRLLLRSARKQVSEDWAWGDESEADLLMMDANSIIDDTAIDRAYRPGIASAQLIGADEPAPPGLFLRKPFHKDDFAALLGIVARRATTLSQNSDAVAGAIEPGRAIPPQVMLRSGDDATPAPGKAADPAVDDNLMRSLMHYLPKRVLGGPAQIALPDAPVLMIDPESRTFWTTGTLPALEAYIRDPLRFGDWQRLTDDAFEQARAAAFAKPYAYLIWMDSFIHSRGVLSRRLDPEGTYRLTKRLELANDYPRALLISAQMTHARRLDAIARASAANLAEVFDVVNAYEAIGYLEWTRKGVPSAR